MNNQDPMSLKNLPEYLKSAKSQGDTGCVVNMGMIEPEKKSWLIPSLSACIILLAIGGGVATYNFVTPQEFTVAVFLNNNDQKSIEKIVANFDKNAKLITVTKKENGIQELKISTRKSKRAFLDSIKNIKD